MLLGELECAAAVRNAETLLSPLLALLCTLVRLLMQSWLIQLQS